MQGPLKIDSPGTYGPASQKKPPAVTRPSAAYQTQTSPLASKTPISKSVVGQGVSSLPSAPNSNSTAKLTSSTTQMGAAEVVSTILNNFAEMRKQAELGKAFGLEDYTRYWLRGRMHRR